MDASLNWAYIGDVYNIRTGGGLQVSGLLFMTFSWIYFVSFVGQYIGENSQPPSSSTEEKYAMKPTNNTSGSANESLTTIHESAPSIISITDKQNSKAPDAAAPVLCRAKALFSYQANPEDPTEISFTKGDVLDVLENKGKWWHTRKTNPDGSIESGIAPSNYLQVL